MKAVIWLIAIAACLRDKQFWRETAAETLQLITSPSNGLGIALAALVLRIGHRIFAASSMQG